MSFAEFESLEADASSSAERDVFDRTEAEVLRQMNPPWSTVLPKLIGLQAIASFVLLGFCPQFGIRTFGHGHWSFFDLFMFFGHEVCSVLCGAFFMSGGLFLASFLLDLDAWNKIKKMPEIPVAAVSAATLSVFWLMGAHMYGIHVILWVVGAFAVGTLVLRPYQQRTLLYRR